MGIVFDKDLEVQKNNVTGEIVVVAGSTRQHQAVQGSLWQLMI
jgi:hypothetical protein